MGSLRVKKKEETSKKVRNGRDGKSLCREVAYFSLLPAFLMRGAARKRPNAREPFCLIFVESPARRPRQSCHLRQSRHLCLRAVPMLGADRQGGSIALLIFQQLTVCDQFATSMELPKPVNDLSA
jgi:hypothetical protein